ncbi:hypothetical protein AVEN_242758-1 [Araneus ventricosus]|uniref:Uncharacterized protein n=1 Tax=Araneus ventricosus TaxID=182803 RepID=A0A4Y2D3B4_ARAVE|nr:hypothetical protein AVEN_101721-1 [Araneus ventricosus]GBM10659.1 hypothetical protein AVEN_242758-1 [Araneus ventricosus]
MNTDCNTAKEQFDSNTVHVLINERTSHRLLQIFRRPPPAKLLRRIHEKIKRMNMAHEINFGAKKAGDFVKIFLHSTDDHCKFIKNLNGQNQQHYAISDGAVKPIKAVIKCLLRTVMISEDN